MSGEMSVDIIHRPEMPVFTVDRPWDKYAALKDAVLQSVSEGVACLNPPDLEYGVEAIAELKQGK